MTGRRRPPQAAGELRPRADRKARKAAATEPLKALSAEEQQRLLSELQVHQIELEMQNEELRRAQGEVEKSRQRYFDLYNLAPIGYCTLSEAGLILEANLAAARMLGVDRTALVGKPLARQVSREDQDLYYLQLRRLSETGSPQSREIRMRREDGATSWARVEVSAARASVGAGDATAVTIQDITDHHQAVELMQVRLRLQQYAESSTMSELLQRTLDEIGTLTGSPIGFYHFVEADQKTLSLQAWSTQTRERFCRAEGAGMHYSIDEAGVWADCVRERRPVIHNDYAALERRKGMPEGHAEVTRELVVPVFRGDRIVAVLGVGNKPHDYQRSDVKLLEDLADFAWSIAEKKRADEALRRANLIVENSPVVLFRWKAAAGWPVEMVSDNVVRFGYTPDELRSGAVAYASIVCPEDLDRVAREVQEYSASGASHFRQEYRIVSKDGTVRWVDDRTTVVRDSSGQAAFYEGVVIDITERKQAEDALRESEERFRALIANQGVGVGIVDAEEVIIFANPAAEEIFGVAPGSLVGRSTLEFVEPAGRALVDAEADHRRRGVRSEYEMSIRRTDGERRTVLVTATPRLVAGSVAGAFGVFRDITDRRRAEEALRKAEQQLRALLDSIPDLAWLKDREGRFLAANAPFARACGVPQAKLVGKTDLDAWPADLAERYRADDRLVVESGRTTRVEELLEDAPSGQRRWIDTIKAPIVDEAGAVTGTAGIARDITERKQAAEEQQRLHRELESAVETLQRRSREDALVKRLNDLLQSCQDTREAYRAIELSLPELFRDRPGWLAIADAQGKALEIVAAWGERHRDAAVFTRDECWGLRRGQPHEVTDPASALLCWHLAEPVVADYLCLPLLERREPVGLLHLKAVTARNGGAGDCRQLAVTVGETINLSLSNLRLRESLREQSIRDALTGLHNRRFLDEVLQRELRLCLRRKAPLTLAMADLDHFKRFNDAHGHQAGDLLLRELAALLKDTLRAVDIVCRFGGEEFALVLPESPVEAVLPRLEELRQQAHNLQVEIDGERATGVSISIGVAQAPIHGSTAEDLLRAADRALYAAKKSGRDRTVVFDSA